MIHSSLNGKAMVISCRSSRVPASRTEFGGSRGTAKLDRYYNGPQSAWTQNRFQLTIAAMPSLHFSTSAYIGVCLWNFAPRTWLRWLAPLWPLAVLLTILGAANHFVLDAIAGAVIPVLSWKMNEAFALIQTIGRVVFLAL